VFTSQRGSLGWVSEFFEVRAQVDRGLTTVSFDWLLGLIKNLGRHISSFVSFRKIDWHASDLARVLSQLCSACCVLGVRC
jgi:hypothetical protein